TPQPAHPLPPASPPSAFPPARQCPAPSAGSQVPHAQSWVRPRSPHPPLHATPQGNQTLSSQTLSQTSPHASHPHQKHPQAARLPSLCTHVRDCAQTPRNPQRPHVWLCLASLHSFLVHSLRGGVWFRIRWKRLNGDSRLVGQLDQLFAVKKKRPSRIHGERRRPGFPHLLDGRQANHRYIKPHILFRLANLHDDQPFPGPQPRRSFYRLIRAFHRLHGNARLVRNHHGLPDVHPCNLSRHIQPVSDVDRFFLIRSSRRQHTSVRHQRLQEMRRIHQVNPLILQNL